MEFERLQAIGADSRPVELHSQFDCWLAHPGCQSAVRAKQHLSSFPSTIRYPVFTEAAEDMLWVLVV